MEDVKHMMVNTELLTINILTAISILTDSQTYDD